MATPQEVFERIESLANTLITVAKKLYVIGIPRRIPPETEIENFEDHELIRHLAVNQRLANASKEVRWNFRGLAEHVYSEMHFSDRDCVHLSEKGISQSRVILKTKVFYEHYSIELEQQGHPNVYERSSASDCKCGSFLGSR